MPRRGVHVEVVLRRPIARCSPSLGRSSPPRRPLELRPDVDCCYVMVVLLLILVVDDFSDGDCCYVLCVIVAMCKNR